MKRLVDQQNETKWNTKKSFKIITILYSTGVPWGSASCGSAPGELPRGPNLDTRSASPTCHRPWASAIVWYSPILKQYMHAYIYIYSYKYAMYSPFMDTFQSKSPILNKGFPIAMFGRRVARLLQVFLPVIICWCHFITRLEWTWTKYVESD